MRQLNATQIADRYVAGMQGASTRYKEGIDAVQEAPGAKAAAQQDKALTNYSKSITSGKWASRVASVTIDQWKALAKSKGATNLAGGAVAARSKVQSYWNSAIPFMQQLQARINQMPNNTPADADARMLAWSNGMREFAAQRS